jgi:hypothetical protein
MTPWASAADDSRERAWPIEMPRFLWRGSAERIRSGGAVAGQNHGEPVEGEGGADTIADEVLGAPVMPATPRSLRPAATAESMCSSRWYPIATR